MGLIQYGQTFDTLPVCTQTPTTNSQLVTKTYVDSTFATITGAPTLAGTNAFTGTNTFNTSLPTSTVTPSNAADLITKTFADSTYGRLASANAWTSTNTFNTSLPTSTVTPSNASDLVTKTYVDSNTWTITSGTVTTTDATVTTILTIPVPTSKVIGIMVFFVGGESTSANGISGFLQGGYRNSGGTVSSLALPWVSMNRLNTSMFVQTANSGSNVLVQVAGLAATTIVWNATVNIITT